MDQRAVLERVNGVTGFQSLVRKIVAHILPALPVDDFRFPDHYDDVHLHAVNCQQSEIHLLAAEIVAAFDMPVKLDSFEIVADARDDINPHRELTIMVEAVISLKLSS